MGWVVCWVHLPEGTWGEPEGGGSPLPPLPHRYPRRVPRELVNWGERRPAASRPLMSRALFRKQFQNKLTSVGCPPLSPSNCPPFPLPPSIRVCFMFLCVVPTILSLFLLFLFGHSFLFLCVWLPWLMCGSLPPTARSLL